MLLSLLAVLFAAVVTLRLAHRGQRGKTGGGEPFPAQLYDFGSGKVGATVSHDFIVANPTDQPVRVLKAVPSCSCTVVGALPESIPGHGQMAVTVKATLGAASDRFAQDVALSLEGFPPVLLQLEGEVIRPFPPLIDFGTVRRDEGAVQQFVLRSLTTRPIAVSEARESNGLLETGGARLLPDGTQWLYSLKLRPDVPYGPFSTQLELVTDDPEEATKQIQVRGYVFDSIEAEPQVLNFGVLRGDARTSKTVRVYSPYGEDIDVESVEVLPAALSAHVTVSAEPQSAGTPSASAPTTRTLAVEIRAGHLEKLTDGKLLVTANVGGGNE